MNRERLEELAKRFEAVADGKQDALPHFGAEEEPIGFNMNYLYREFGRADKSGAECGSVCCIAGWVNLLFVPWKPREWGTDSAREALELGTNDADELFYPAELDDEEDPELNPYNAGPREAAKVIRGLLETGEVDWKSAMKEATP